MSALPPESYETKSWGEAVVYQVYPRSFQEERDGDDIGEGTLLGITKRLDYLRDLGVTALWISPFYPSPMKDGGYDISDHTDVDERFGTLEHFKELVGEAHARGLKIIVDLVLNHTSDQHRWFQESRNPDSEKSDWYVWHQPRFDESGNRVPPNNWASVFSMYQHERRLEGDITVPEGEFTPPVSAWKWDEERGEYYLHSFASHQPDLNWANPNVREAAKDIMRFWIDLGVDGFRADAIPYIGKNPSFEDEERDPKYHEDDRQETRKDKSVMMDYPNPYDQLRRENSCGYMPTLKPHIEELCAVLDEYPDRDLRIMHEAYMSAEKLEEVAALSTHNSSTFNFTALDVAWNATDYRYYLNRYHENLANGATPNQVRGNHDKPRMASPHVLGIWSAKAAAVMNFTLPGHIYTYYGDEIAMVDQIYIPDEDITDKLGYRDYSRTPMQWNTWKNAGFSKADKTWLPVDPLYIYRNVVVQRRNPISTLNLYRRLLHLRKSHPALKNPTSMHTLDTSHPNTLAFVRGEELGDQAIITVVNFSDETVRTNVAFDGFRVGSSVVSSMRIPKPIAHLGNLWLLPNEAIVIRRSSSAGTVSKGAGKVTSGAKRVTGKAERTTRRIGGNVKMTVKRIVKKTN